MQHGDIPGFPPIKRAQVVNNTFVGQGGGAIELGGTSHSIAPRGLDLRQQPRHRHRHADQRARSGRHHLAGEHRLSDGRRAGARPPADQIKVVDPQLMKVGEIWRPGAGGPTVDAARAGFAFVTQDIDGRPRTTTDVGAHEAGPPGHGPLTPADVGPDAP
jgi:hypothetical protein